MNPSPSKNEDQKKQKKGLWVSLIAFLSALLLVGLLLLLIFGIKGCQKQEASTSSASENPYAYLDVVSTSMHDLEEKAIHDGEEAYPDAYYLDGKVKQGSSITTSKCSYVKEPFSFLYQEGLDSLTTTYEYKEESGSYSVSINGGSYEAVSYNQMKDDLDASYGLYEEAVDNLPEQVQIIDLLKGDPSKILEKEIQYGIPGTFGLSLSGEDLDLRPSGQVLKKLEISYTHYICTYFHKVYEGESGEEEIEYRFSSVPFAV